VLGSDDELVTDEGDLRKDLLIVQPGIADKA